MRSTRRLALAAAAVLGLSLAGLPARAADPILIGIAQWGPHPQLDAVAASFQARLSDLARAEGKTLRFSIESAHFDTAVLPQMISKLRAERPALVLTVATPPSQAAKQVMRGSGIPVVFGAVVDPVLAKLTPSWTEGAEDMTGASNQEDITQVLGFIRKLFPAAKRIGFPYNPGEDNNVSVAERLKAAAPAAGFSVTEVAVAGPADVALRIAALKGQADVIYTPSGGVIQPSIPAISAAAAQIGLPVVDSGVGWAKQGIVLAGFALDYATVGVQAANIADKILNGTKPAAIPPVRPGPKDYEMAISAAQMKKFGVTLPESLKDCGCVKE